MAIYLVDSNVWLELILGQSQSTVAADFFARTPIQKLAITDYAVHSILLRLLRGKQFNAARDFAADVAKPNRVQIVSHTPERLTAVLRHVETLKLDFDDAYQYEAAELLDATIVTFDADFNSTPRRGISPALAELSTESDSE